MLLNWWLGRSTESVENDGHEVEPPETPAPVFAARALKSAFFGTPAHKDEDNSEEVPESVRVTNEDNSKTSRTQDASPTKPQGILLTPGMGTTRRKTVSFGANVTDNEEKNSNSRSGIPNNCPGKFPSPWTPKVEANQQQTRRTALTKSLEAVRDSKGKSSARTNLGSNITTESSNDVQVYRHSKLGKEDTNFDNGPLRKALISKDWGNTSEDLGDMTVDLNEPHSQSGQYWKSEYERYQEDAKAEMAKLVKYKQLAKSYAKMKDDEAIGLREKLNEEQQKVAKMEKKISGLVAQISGKRISSDDDESLILMKALARQTDLTTQHRDHVEKFPVALQEGDVPENRESGGESAAPISSTPPTLESSVELRRVREQAKEIGSLRAEMHSLRLSLSAAEKKVSRLCDENQKLSEDLTRAKDGLENSERSREFAENEKKKGEEQLRSLQSEFDNIKALAKSQRREAEIKLKRRSEQLATAKAKISSLEEIQNKDLGHPKNGVPSKAGGRDEEKHSNSQSKVQNEEVEDLISLDDKLDPPGCKRIRDQTTIDCPLNTRIENPKSQAATETSSDKTNTFQQDPAHPIESRIPVLDKSVTRSRKTPTSVPGKALENTVISPDIRQSTRSALLEIANIEDINNSQAETDGGPGHPIGSSSEPSSNPSPNRPTSLVRPRNGTFHEKRCIASPRPSMFVIPSSPTKQPSKGTLLSNRAGVENRSNNARASLPADRIAAARVRLEQRKEKKKAQLQDDQKENSRA